MNDFVIKGCAAIIVIAICATGCSWYSRNSVIHGSRQDAMPICAFPKEAYLENLHFVMPTVGLFVGVSEFEDKAKVVSTPAHALSAGFFQSPFFQSAFF